MKLSSLITIVACCAALAPPAAAQKRARAAASGGGAQTAERSVAAAPDAAVSLCLNNGDVTVRGWDRNEVQARATEAGGLRLQATGGEAARRVDVLVSMSPDGETNYGDCGSVESLDVSVPRGASVSVRMRNGHTEVTGVAEARVESFNGDVGVSRVGRAVEVSSLSGDVSVSDVTGRVRLRAVSGGVEASNLRRSDEGDVLDVSSTSGDVVLNNVSYARVRGAAISGKVEMRGPLARGGSYEFKTISGDVTLSLPADSSFKINASVVADGEIVTDFAVRAAANTPEAPQTVVVPAPPDARGKGRQVRVNPPTQTRLVGTVGAGEADVRVSSFSGTLHLKKQ